MKLTKVEQTSTDRERFVFSIGREEIEVLVGCLTKARTYTPKTFETAATCARINNMERALRNSLKA